jgi:hypothetical protein
MGSSPAALTGVWSATRRRGPGRTLPRALPARPANRPPAAKHPDGRAVRRVSVRLDHAAAPSMGVKAPRRRRGVAPPRRPASVRPRSLSDGEETHRVLDPADGCALGWSRPRVSVGGAGLIVCGRPGCCRGIRELGAARGCASARLRPAALVVLVAGAGSALSRGHPRPARAERVPRSTDVARRRSGLVDVDVMPSRDCGVGRVILVV